MNSIHLAVVTPRLKAGEVWGAERYYEGLMQALNTDGVSAEMVPVTID